MSQANGLLFTYFLQLKIDEKFQVFKLNLFTPNVYSTSLKN